MSFFDNDNDNDNDTDNPKLIVININNGIYPYIYLSFIADLFTID